MKRTATSLRHDRSSVRCAVLALALVLALPAQAAQTYLDVRLNSRKAIAAEAVEFDAPSPGVLSAPPAIWQSFGLLLNSDEEDQAILTTTQLGLSFVIDNPTMSVDFQVPAGRLPDQQLGWQDKPSLGKVSPSAKGVLVNYDIAAAYNPRGGAAVSVGHDVRTSLAGGVLVTTGQLNVSRSGTEYVRGYTTWTKDLPDKRLSFQVGDIQTHPTGPSSSVAMAGVRVASDPALDPTQPSFPVPILGGVAAAPSQVQGYLNGSALQPYDVEAGGFEYANVGLSSGLNTGQMVLTDKFGRQTVVDSRFYLSTDLLRPGLSRWEVNAGLLRKGMTNTYTTPALSASYARGMTDHWTAEAHVEATRNGHNTSLGSKLVLGSYGSLGLTAGKSSSRLGSGTAWGVDYAYNARKWSMGLSHVQQSDNWWQLSHETGGSHGALNATSAWGSYRFNDHWALAGSVSRVRQGQDERNRAELRLDYHRERAYLSVSVARDGSDNQFRLTYSRPLGSMDGAIDYTRNRRGSRVEARLNGDNATRWGDVRWNTRIGSSNGARYGSASARLDNPKYDANVRLDVYGNDTTLSGGYRSSLWIGEGGIQQSKSQGTTLAVVRVGNVEGVPVYLENKLVGKTNATGALVIGPVHQLIPNSIRIGERALPPGTEVDSTEVMAIPNRNHVALVDFQLASEDARMFTVKFNDGTFPALGSAATTNLEQGMVGYDGGVYLERPTPGQVLTVTSTTGMCKATVPSPLPAFDEVAVLTCE